MLFVCLREYRSKFKLRKVLGGFSNNDVNWWNMRISTSWIRWHYGGIREIHFFHLMNISPRTRRTRCGCHVEHWTMNVSLLSSQFGTIMTQVIQSFAGWGMGFFQSCIPTSGLISVFYAYPALGKALLPARHWRAVRWTGCFLKCLLLIEHCYAGSDLDIFGYAVSVVVNKLPIQFRANECCSCYSMMIYSSEGEEKPLYIFPFMWYDAPRAVRIGDNSLNSAQAHLTLTLAASSTPPPAPSVSPK